eukprot:1074994-Rhodomonas_salina.1
MARAHTHQHTNTHMCSSHAQHHAHTRRRSRGRSRACSSLGHMLAARPFVASLAIRMSFIALEGSTPSTIRFRSTCSTSPWSRHASSYARSPVQFGPGTVRAGSSRYSSGRTETDRVVGGKDVAEVSVRVEACA